MQEFVASTKVWYEIYLYFVALLTEQHVLHLVWLIYAVKFCSAGINHMVMSSILVMLCWLVVWCIGNGFVYINKVKLCWAWLVLGLVTCGGYFIPIFIQDSQSCAAWPSHHVLVQWVLAMVLATAGKKWRVLCSSGPCYQDCWLILCYLNWVLLSLAKRSKGMSSERWTLQYMCKSASSVWSSRLYHCWLSFTGCCYYYYRC